ncbi:MAG: hypothetical protein M0R49_08375 [Limnochordia bacterium]|nr:hypothetical protein [Limnochordia bacterium]
MAKSGVGVSFQRWAAVGSSGDWEEIAEIRSITGPSMTRDTIDTTTLNTEGGYRTFITGFRNPGTLALSMNYTRAGYEALKDDFENDDLQNYRIVLPDDDETVLEFEGIVTEIPLTIPEELIAVDTVIQISGKVDLYSNSSGA